MRIYFSKPTSKSSTSRIVPEKQLSQVIAEWMIAIKDLKEWYLQLEEAIGYQSAISSLPLHNSINHLYYLKKEVTQLLRDMAIQIDTGAVLDKDKETKRIQQHTLLLIQWCKDIQLALKSNVN